MNVGVAVGSTVCVTVTIANDNLVENNETFSITITTGSKSTVISPRIVSYITIIDNDGKCFFTSLECSPFPMLQGSNSAGASL